jgi:anti-anti-sigma regulatory factor
LREALDELDTSGADPDGSVHLELRDLHFIDAAGARALIHLAKTVAGRRIVLHNPPYALRRIIDVLWGQPGYIRVDMS